MIDKRPLQNMRTIGEWELICGKLTGDRDRQMRGQAVIDACDMVEQLAEDKKARQNEPQDEDPDELLEAEFFAGNGLEGFTV